jgi:very-short-patch-repair endonuclease
MEKVRLKYGIPIQGFYWQTQCDIPSAPMRVDFLVSMPDGEGSVKQLVVECDGHEFHEKTKEQAKKDKQRDRALTRMGLPIFHFTGSEVWDDFERCGKEVLDFLHERAHGCKIEEPPSSQSEGVKEEAIQ